MTAKQDGISLKQSIQADVAKAITKQDGPVLKLRQTELDKAKTFVRDRLASAIREVATRGDYGKISSILSDLRALDFVTAGEDEVKPSDGPSRPLREDEQDAADRAAARRAAASDDALMQEQNRQQNLRDRNEAVLTEVHGLSVEEVEKMPDAEVAVAAKRRGR